VLSIGSAKKQQTLLKAISIYLWEIAPKAKANFDIAIAHDLIAKQHPFYESEDFFFQESSLWPNLSTAHKNYLGKMR
jgi:hypothetical protein